VFGVSVVCLWCVCGVSVVCLWCVCLLCLGCVFGVSVMCIWCVCGVCHCISAVPVLLLTACGGIRLLRVVVWHVTWRDLMWCDVV
jgi:hypothetical protein